MVVVGLLGDRDTLLALAQAVLSAVRFMMFCFAESSSLCLDYGGFAVTTLQTAILPWNPPCLSGGRPNVLQLNSLTPRKQ